MSRACDPGSDGTTSAISVLFTSAAKVAVVAGFFTLWAFVYGLINEWAYGSPRTAYFPSPREALPGVIQPWTAVIYVFGGFAAPVVSLMFNWPWPKLRFVLRTYAPASAVLFAALVTFPVGMHRPEYTGPGLDERLMRWVFSVDRETNCFPSSHTMFAVASALLVGHGGASRWVRVASWILAASVCATTVTTGQHYYMDVAAGAMTAAAGYLAAIALARCRSR